MVLRFEGILSDQLIMFKKTFNFRYFANVHGSRVEHKFEHLACFCGGMLALHANNQENKTVKVLLPFL